MAAYRVFASRLLPGRILGGFKYYGTRPDDPNDVIPHEHRRELRALKVFGAWTNLVDLKALNTIDTLITENGRARVRHYLQDVGSTFGMGAIGSRAGGRGMSTCSNQTRPSNGWRALAFISSRGRPSTTTSILRWEGSRETNLTRMPGSLAVPVGALLRARTDDDFWAARRVMAFSDELIRAIVKTGHYSDPKAEEHLGTVLIKRRNKIGQAYLSSHQSFSQFFADTFRCFDVRKRRGENWHGQGTCVLRSHVVGVQQQHRHDQADRRNQRLKRADERSVRFTVQCR